MEECLTKHSCSNTAKFHSGICFCIERILPVIPVFIGVSILNFLHIAYSGKDFAEEIAR